MATWRAEDDTLIYYEQYGADNRAPVLLLLPGLLGAISSQWRPFVEPLSASYHVVLMDLRGHGRSENSEMHLEPQRLVRDVSGLLDFLEIGSLHVAGYSLGGYVGLMLCLSQPKRVQTLLMHATKFYWTRDAVAKMHQQFDPQVLTETAPTYADQLAREHGSRWRPLVRQAADLVGLLAEEGVTEQMARRVQTPVLVSVGDRDELVPLREAARLSRIFPGGGLLVLPHARHPLKSVPAAPMLSAMVNFHQNSKQ
ncbi:MAG TPA: alpha/beta hydrolase [Candidatus Sulfomarinibacteraceae bacterium]|nr:alpha/beta hydrolase [Candidatus Sulfomarinibacteraceae bacterium]